MWPVSLWRSPPPPVPFEGEAEEHDALSRSASRRSLGDALSLPAQLFARLSALPYTSPLIRRAHQEQVPLELALLAGMDGADTLLTPAEREQAQAALAWLSQAHGGALPSGREAAGLLVSALAQHDTWEGRLAGRPEKAPVTLDSWRGLAYLAVPDGWAGESVVCAALLCGEVLAQNREWGEDRPSTSGPGQAVQTAKYLNVARRALMAGRTSELRLDTPTLREDLGPVTGNAPLRRTLQYVAELECGLREHWRAQGRTLTLEETQAVLSAARERATGALHEERHPDFLLLTPVEGARYAALTSLLRRKAAAGAEG